MENRPIHGEEVFMLVSAFGCAIAGLITFLVDIAVYSAPRNPALLVFAALTVLWAGGYAIRKVIDLDKRS